MAQMPPVNLQLSPFPTSYTEDALVYHRRKTREVKVGNVGIGGTNPIRIQSMTISDTLDTESTVKETIELYEAGCEIVRITAPRVKEAEHLGVIKSELKKRGYDIPIVADIHFQPQAAMVAIEHVEKVRINPGNYMDRKKFEQTEYSDAEYAEELEKLHEAFSPLVLRAKDLGRVLRIGTNHGSLSDRIMNRYGDTPEGMVESAVEFIKIAEFHAFYDIVVSMKASNAQVMVQAYRLLVERFNRESMDYPLHLGVTEAGNGQDGRIKSAIGIGSLLNDGLGDTIRVSLTENSIFEIPVAQKVASYFTLENRNPKSTDPRSSLQADNTISNQTKAFFTAVNPYTYQRRKSKEIQVAETKIGGSNPVKLGIRTPDPIPSALTKLGLDFTLSAESTQVVHVNDFDPSKLTDSLHIHLIVDNVDLETLKQTILQIPNHSTGFLYSIESKDSTETFHTDATHLYRLLTLAFYDLAIDAPILLFGKFKNQEEALYQASIHFGALLLDGIGDALLVETAENTERVTLLQLELDILQAARLRLSKTEFISCPSCGRTLFDLQTTTERIKKRTGHLKGVKIAIMGCVVNGPGEMADADFGYVGAGPGHIHLYKGHDIVKKSVPSEIADEELVKLISEFGLWVEPEA